MQPAERAPAAAGCRGCARSRSRSRRRRTACRARGSRRSRGSRRTRASPSSSGPTRMPEHDLEHDHGQRRRAWTRPPARTPPARRRRPPPGTSRCRPRSCERTSAPSGATGTICGLSGSGSTRHVPRPPLAGVGDVGPGARGQLRRGGARAGPAAARPAPQRPAQPADPAVRRRADHGRAGRRDDHLHRDRVLRRVRGRADPDLVVLAAARGPAAARPRRDRGLALPTATASYSLFALATIGREADRSGEPWRPRSP